MAFSTTYSNKQRSIFDIKTLIEALKFILIHVILAFIFLFLIMEEIDWSLFLFREQNNDKVIDNTSWNIKNIVNL